MQIFVKTLTGKPSLWRLTPLTRRTSSRRSRTRTELEAFLPTSSISFSLASSWKMSEDDYNIQKASTLTPGAQSAWRILNYILVSTEHCLLLTLNYYHNIVFSCFSQSCFYTCPSPGSAATMSVLTSPQSPIPELPSFQPLCDANFSWGELDGPECIATIDRCYNEAVHWIRNLFMVPPGNTGKAFIKELFQLF